MVRVEGKRRYEVHILQKISQFLRTDEFAVVHYFYHVSIHVF
jgi:hypothetical protein